MPTGQKWSKEWKKSHIHCPNLLRAVHLYFASLAVVRDFGGIGDRQIYLAVVQTFHVLLTFDVRVVDGPVVAGEDAAQIAEIVKHLDMTRR